MVGHLPCVCRLHTRVSGAAKWGVAWMSLDVEALGLQRPATPSRALCFCLF